MRTTPRKRKPVRPIDRLPRQYRDSVAAFFKDNDGWWIMLEEDGPYHFPTYYSKYTIHEDTQRGAMAQFLACVAEKPKSDVT